MIFKFLLSYLPSFDNSVHAGYDGFNINIASVNCNKAQYKRGSEAGNESKVFPCEPNC